MKRVLSLILACILLAGCISAVVLAEGAADPVLDTGVVVTVSVTGSGEIKLSERDDSSKFYPVVNGQAAVPANTAIKIEAVPGEGQRLLSLAAKGIALTLPYTVSFQSADMDKTIAAVFEPMQYSVTYTAPTGGTLSVTNSGQPVASGTKLDWGTVLTVAATPDEGHALDTLTAGGTPVASGATFTLKQDTTVAASFKALQHSVTYDAPVNGTLSVTNGGQPVASGTKLDWGTELVVTATPSDGYVLDTLTAGGTPIASGAPYTLKGDILFAAAFKTADSVPVEIPDTQPADGKLTIYYNGQPLTADTTLPVGAQLEFRIVPNDGKELVTLTVNGEIIYDLNSPARAAAHTGDTITVPYTVKEAVTSVAATFQTAAKRDVTVTLPTLVTEQGTLTIRNLTQNKVVAAGTGTVQTGDRLQFELTPKSGYQITAFNVTGVNENMPALPSPGRALTFAAAVKSDATALTVTASLGAYAPNGDKGSVAMPTGVFDDDGDTLEDKDGDAFNIDSIAGDGRITLDGVRPNRTFYIQLGDDRFNPTTILDDGCMATASQLADDSLFRISIDKEGDGKSLIRSITQVNEKRLGGSSTRGSYLKVVLKDSTSTDEKKATATVTFKARNTLKTADGDEGDWHSGDCATLDITMWIANTKTSGSDHNINTGDNVYLDPDDNDWNVYVWGDDRAALEFYASDDADSFYARLSTKADVDIYSEYGDPVDANLWFYDFVGHPEVPSSSRAYLTLGIPWDEDDDYTPYPNDCYIYEVDSRGNLTDVTSSFSYSRSEREIPGWTTRTRTLGTYIVSDTELDLEQDYDIDLDDNATDSYEEQIKVNPSTGGGNSTPPVTQTILPPPTASGSDGISSEPAGSEPAESSEPERETAQTGQIDVTEPTVPQVTQPASNQRRSFPLFGVLAAAVVLACAGGAAYLVYLKMHDV
ncbi:InlB B-repeat-containing protein [Anaerotruncus colihominis]|uniref:Bacterial repeat domain-containing protein n=1 Tax=Anaerotruncus colihominis TaxID=169435 RepID=A0A3E3IJE5_9FIRM|nr:hypothetical protein [Anaerotruncus colihominis]RGE67219.1 hypothetical protein DXC40_10405 [Anaerotruncus colihominis]